MENENEKPAADTEKEKEGPEVTRLESVTGGGQKRPVADGDSRDSDPPKR